MKLEQLRLICRWGLLALIVLNPSVAASNGEESTSIDGWVRQRLGKGESRLCAREVDGEYFFAARGDNQVKVGSRLDMTEYQGAHSFILAWIFQNEKGAYLASNVQPTTVKEEYLSSGGRTYAERVQYQTLNLAGSREMHIAVAIKKCPSVQCDRQERKNQHERQYTIKLCEVSLTK